MRYTEKDETWCFPGSGCNLHYVGTEPIYVNLDKTDIDYFEGFINKLGEHEDIDDDIGIEWPVIYKALKNGIYDIENDEFIRYVEFLYSDKCDEWYIVDAFNEYKTYAPKDYGKTWVLTKEELK